MGGDLRLVELGSVATVRSGFAFKSSDWTDSGIPVVKIANVKNGNVVLDGCSFVAPDVANSKAEFLLEAGDILIAMTGYIGDVALVRERDIPAVLNQRVGRFSICDAGRLDRGFLFYFLRDKGTRKQIEGLGHGSAQPNVSPSLIHGIEVPLPPLSEQRAIAHILGALDDKIELNRQMNETLEAIARAVFKSWFVDFDPVRAKADGRDPVGVNRKIAGLFPDGFEDSAQGQIPRGWTVEPLSLRIEVNPKRELKKGAIAPYLDMKNMPTKGHCPDDIYPREFGSGTRFMNGDTLVARISPSLENGKTAFVDFLSEGEIGWGSTEHIVLRPVAPLPYVFAYLLARSEDFRSFAVQSMTGSSGRQRVQVDSICSYQLPFPDEGVATLFGRIVEPLFAEARANSEESTILAEIRDTLLPKLLSGEIRIKDAEKLVEEAGMSRKTEDLFPASFEDSALGQIPKGWTIGELGGLVANEIERVTANHAKDDERYISLDDMPHKSIDLSSFRMGSEVSSGIIRFRKGDILFGSMRPYFHKVGLASHNGITRTTTLVLRPRQDHLRHFSLLHFSSDDVVSHSTAASVGTTIPYVKWDALSNYNVAEPPPFLLEKFEALCSPLTNRIAVNGEEARTLGKIRDALLPKLLTGEIRIQNSSRLKARW